MYESILTTEKLEEFGRVCESKLTTENQIDLVVCMKVYLLQRIRREWSCV